MIPRENDPHGVRADNDLPIHACCADCSHMNIHLGGEYWCTQFNDEVDPEHVCERWESTF